MENIVIAIAKGRIEKDVYRRLKILNMEGCIETDSRKLIFNDEYNKITYIHVKPSDVVTYVEKGVADLGIVGKDTILENESDNEVYELLDLGFGKCKFALAAPKDSDFYSGYDVKRLASKYPQVTRDFFARKGMDVDIIKIEGSVELAPLLGLVDGIVDLVETGNTLRENGLVEVEDVMQVSARLIVNVASMKLKKNEINALIDKIEALKEEVK